MKSDYTHIAMVLDRSGSMGVIASDTIGGVNHFLREQKAVPGSCTFKLVQFDDVIETVADNLPVSAVAELTSQTYKPRGTTALYDAIGRTVMETGNWLAAKPEAERPAKVLFVIVTDGQENASREFDRAKVFAMITHQREKYGWEFVFIGANQDAYAAAQSVGVSVSNALNYTANSVGTQSLYSDLSKKSAMFRCSASASMAWTDEERAKQESAKQG